MLWSQICNISTIQNILTELNYLQKNYLEHVKMGRNDSKFTIGKYFINTMDIIKLFRINIFMPVSSLENLVILQKEAISDLWSVQGALQRNQRQKLGILR